MGMNDRQESCHVSVVVPAYNEEENVPLLLDAFSEVIAKQDLDWEVILVDDGSTDGTWACAEARKQHHSYLRTVRHHRNRGVTHALMTGFGIARGRILVFFPADLQYLPEEIVKMVKAIEKGADVVAGWKVGQYEKRFVSNVYNTLSRWLFRVPIHDLNSIKAFRREVVDHITMRKDWHRYMVVMAYEQGYRVEEVKVPLYPRQYGRSKFGFWRIPIGVLDIIAVKFQLSVMKKPLLLLGSFGGILILGALVVGCVALYFRFVLDQGFRPLLYLVLLLTVMGISLFILGFLAEAISNIGDRIDNLERKLTKR
jgi:glycosyltransferase involved in cell wall biosynthesis